jgi:hypothetical protein
LSTVNVARNGSLHTHCSLHLTSATAFELSQSFIHFASFHISKMDAKCDCTSAPDLMDVLFLIDATGSMSGALKAAHDRAASMASDLRRQHSDIDFRFGSVCYRDPIDSRGDVHDVCDFTNDIDNLVRFFAGVHASGGGDGPEDWVGALKLSLDRVRWRDGQKTLILIADAPAHGSQFCGHQNHEEEGPKLPPLIKRVAQAGIVVQGLDLNSGASLSFTEFKRIYDSSGGPSCSHEPFNVGYRGSEPPPRRLDVLGRDVDASEYPKDFPSDEDYDEDDDARGLPRRRNRAPVIDDTAIVIVSEARSSTSEDLGDRFERAAAEVVARARAIKK